MGENTPRLPRGAGEVFTFLAGVALPVLSAGILVNEVLRETAGTFVVMDAVLSARTTRLLGASAVVLGFSVCLAMSFERLAGRAERRSYRVFLLVNLVLMVGWGVLLLH